MSTVCNASGFIKSMVTILNYHSYISLFSVLDKSMNASIK